MCFTLAWLFQTLIWLVIVAGVAAIVWVILPILLAWLGVAGDVVLRVLKIIVTVIVIVALLWFVYDLLVCFGGGRGFRVSPG